MSDDALDRAFRRMLEGLKQADEARDEIMDGLTAGWDARKGLSEQIADLRDTVSQLQQLVLTTQQEVQTLRQRLEGRL